MDRKRDNRVCTRRCGGLIICAALMMLTFPSLFCPAETGDAVRVTLKNKGKISGTVLEENEGYVTIDMGFGTTAISRVDIERVDILDENEAYGMSRRTGSVNKTAEEQAWKERIEKNKRISEELIIKRQRAAEHKIKFDDPASIETEAIIDGKVSARFIVDTGAALVVISPSTAEKAGYALTASSRKVSMRLADGSTAEGTAVTLKSVEVAGLKAENVEAVVAGTEKGEQGLLGMSFLKRFNMHIDAEKKELVLKEI